MNKLRITCDYSSDNSLKEEDFCDIGSSDDDKNPLQNDNTNSLRLDQDVDYSIDNNINCYFTSLRNLRFKSYSDTINTLIAFQQPPYPSGSFYPFNPINLGTNTNERVGSTIFMDALLFRYTIYAGQFPNTYPATIRTLVIYDRTPSRAPVKFTDIINTQATIYNDLMFQNLNFIERFEILYDNFITFNIPYQTGNIVQNNSTITYTRYIKIKKKAIYYQDSTDCTHGNLYFLTFGSRQYATDIKDSNCYFIGAFTLTYFDF